MKVTGKQARELEYQGQLLRMTGDKAHQYVSLSTVTDYSIPQVLKFSLNAAQNTLSNN